MAKNLEKLSVGFLYDDTLDSTDGVAQYVKTLGSWLSERGHKVTYLVGQTESTRWKGGEVFSLSWNVRLGWAGNRMSISLIPHRKRIIELMSTRKFDVLHVQVPYSPFMAQLVINRARPATAVVGTVHVFPSGWASRMGSRLLRRIYGKSLARFDLMLSVSRAARLYAKEEFRKDSQISPNVIKLADFKRIPIKQSPNGRRIVFLGRLVERKGCEHLIKAFGLIQKKLPDARLLIAGDGPDRKRLERISGSLGVSDRITFLGRVSEVEKIKILAAADIACFPSLYGESFGIVLIEAMAAGSKVVLGGNNPGYSSVLDGQKELLIDPKDTKGFAARLIKLLTDEESAKRLHVWQKAQVNKYDIEAVGPQVESLYRQAIAIRTRNGHN